MIPPVTPDPTAPSGSSRTPRPLVLACVAFAVFMVLGGLAHRYGNAIRGSHPEQSFYTNLLGGAVFLFSTACLLGTAALLLVRNMGDARRRRSDRPGQPIQGHPGNSQAETTADALSRAFGRVVAGLIAVGTVSAVMAYVSARTLDPYRPRGDWPNPAPSTVAGEILAFASFGGAVFLCVIYGLYLAVRALRRERQG